MPTVPASPTTCSSTSAADASAPQVAESREELISLLEHSNGEESDIVDEQDDIEQDHKDDELEELGSIYGYENLPRFTNVDGSAATNLVVEEQEEDEDHDDDTEELGSKEDSEYSWNSDDHKFH